MDEAYQSVSTESGRIAQSGGRGGWACVLPLGYSVALRLYYVLWYVGSVA